MQAFDRIRRPTACASFRAAFPSRRSRRFPDGGTRFRAETKFRLLRCGIGEYRKRLCSLSRCSGVWGTPQRGARLRGKWLASCVPRHCKYCRFYACARGAFPAKDGRRLSRRIFVRACVSAPYNGNFAPVNGMKKERVKIPAPDGFVVSVPVCRLFRR